MPSSNLLLRLFLCATLILLALPPGAPAVELYTYQTLGPDVWTATAINDLGHVAGNFQSSGDTHGYYWTPAGRLQDLGTLGGRTSNANDLNNRNQIVGYSQTKGDSATGTHAILWQPGVTPRDLGALASDYSIAHGINNLGQIVGYSYDESWRQHAVLWTETGALTDLGYGYARDINDHGLIVGSSGGLACIWDLSGAMIFQGSLGPLHGWNSGNAINSSGQMAGECFNADMQDRAFWYAGGALTALSTLGGLHSGAYGINNLGMVVGGACIAEGFENYHAFLWSAEDGIYDLNDLVLDKPDGVILQFALDINDTGQIVGYSNTSAFLLTPLPPPSGHTPVPGSFLLAGTGLLCLMGARLRGRFSRYASSRK